MTFRKTLIINISEAALAENYWRNIDKLFDQKISLPKDSPEIMKELSDTDCLLVNFGIYVTKEMIDAAPGLKYIGILATAFGKVDITYAKQKGIVVSNLAGYSTESVAEFTVAAILEQMRKLEEGKQRGRNGNYSEAGLKAVEIKGKIFGVIGLGSIGKRVAEIVYGFSADVRYWSRNKKDVPFKYEDIDVLISKSDFISINLAQTSETENIFNAKRLQSLKPGAIVMNTAPMELVDVGALADRLKKEDIIFILDHSDEMKKEDLVKLSQYKNCIIYPPMAYITEEAKINKQEIFLNNIKAFLRGKPQNIVS